MLEPIYWGSETKQGFKLKDSNGNDYSIPEGSKVYAIIKEIKRPDAEELFKQDITNDLVLKLYYNDYTKLKIGNTYWLEITLVKETGEYIPPLFQDQVKIVGVEYGRM